MNLPAHLILCFISLCVTCINSFATHQNINLQSVKESELKRIVSLIDLIPKIVKKTTFTIYQPALDNAKVAWSLTMVNMPYHHTVSSLQNKFDPGNEKYLVDSYSSYISQLDADVHKIYADEDIKKEHLEKYMDVKRIVNAKWAIALFKYLLNSYQQLKSSIKKLLRQPRPTVKQESLFNRLFNKKQVETIDLTQKNLLKALENFVNYDVPELQNLALKIFKTFLADVEHSKMKLPPVSFSKLSLLETDNIQSESPKVVCTKMNDKTIYNLMCLLVKLMNYVDQGIKVDEVNHTVSTALFDINHVDEYDFYAVYLLKTNIEYVNKEKQKFEESIQLFPSLETLISYRWILDFILYISTNCKLVFKTISHNNSENFLKLQELHTKIRLLDHTIIEDEQEICKEVASENRNFDKNIIHQLDTTEAARHVAKNESGSNIRQTLFGPNAGPVTKNEVIAMIAGCAAGITALCYYGYTLTHKQTGQVGENLSLWPDYVRERLNLTYSYLALSLPVTVVPAMLTARSQLLTKMTHSGSLWMWVLAGAMAVGSGWLTRNLKYEHTIPKHCAWAAHYGVMSAVMAPLCVIGGAPVFRALWYVAGSVAGLSTIGMFAPSDNYMKISGPVGMALGTIIVANLGKLYFPPQAVLSGGMHQAMVGAVVLAFSAFILYNNQRVTNMALTMPSHGKPTGENQAKAREDMHMTDRGYDPINAQLSFFMDIFNLGIFMQPREHF